MYKAFDFIYYFKNGTSVKEPKDEIENVIRVFYTFSLERNGDAKYYGHKKKKFLDVKLKLRMISKRKMDNIWCSTVILMGKDLNLHYCYADPPPLAKV